RLECTLVPATHSFPSDRARPLPSAFAAQGRGPADEVTGRDPILIPVPRNRSMRCPQCDQPTLGERQTRQGGVLDVCRRCHGVWFDRGMIYEFSRRPEALDHALGEGLRGRTPTDHRCPRCEAALERGTLPDRDAAVEMCPNCGGLWMSAGELDRA